MLTPDVPFTALLLALYTTGGGVLLRGHLVGTPGANTALLALGTVVASVMGTTGASILLIRPMLRANAFRRRTVHTWVFFIFLVSNIGGSPFTIPAGWPKGDYKLAIDVTDNRTGGTTSIEVPFKVKPAA